MNQSQQPYQTCFGRVREIAEVNAWYIHRTMPLCVIGPAGCGKTHLVRWALEQCTDEVVFCALGQCRDVVSILNALVLVTSLGHLPDPQQALEHFFVSHPDVLIILDDVTSCVHALNQVLQQWSPHVRRRVVLTSRVGVANTQLMQLSPWSPEDARLYFDDQCARVVNLAVGDEASEDVDRLLEQLDYLPMAITLAVPMMAMMSPRALADALPSRFAAIQPRLHRAIQASVSMLDRDVKNLLEYCAVLEGGFGLDMLDAIPRSADDTWVGALIGVLLRHHLVYTRTINGQRCFFVYECVRADILSTMSASTLQTKQAQIQSWLLAQLLKWQGVDRLPRARELYDWCDLYGDRIRHAIVACCDVEAWEWAMSLLLHWTMLSRHVPISQTLQQMIEIRSHLEPIPPTLEQLYALLSARLENDRGDLNSACKWSELAMSRARPESSFWLMCAQTRARILRDMGRLDDALLLLISGLDVALRLQLPAHEVPIRAALAQLLINVARFGRDDQAMARAEAILDVALPLQHLVSAQLVASCLDTRALLLHEQGRTKQGQLVLADLISQMDSAPKEYTDVLRLVIYAHAGILAFAMCDFEQALEHAQRSARVCQRLGHRERYARSMVEQGMYALVDGQLDEAERFLLMAEELSQRQAQVMSQLTAMTQLVILYCERQQPAQVRFWYERALPIAREVSATGHAGLLSLWGSLGADSTTREALLNDGAVALSQAWEYQTPAEQPRWQVLKNVMMHMHKLLDVPALFEAGHVERVRTISIDTHQFIEGNAQHDAINMDPFLVVARRQLASMFDAVVSRYSMPQMLEHAEVLVVESHGLWFERRGERVSLNRRETLRRLFVALLDRWRPAPAEPELTTMEDMIAFGWPDEILEHQSAINRVYASVRLLRKLGLRDVLLHQEGGYFLDPHVFFHILEMEFDGGQDSIGDDA